MRNYIILFCSMMYFNSLCQTIENTTQIKTYGYGGISAIAGIDLKYLMAFGRGDSVALSEQETFTDLNNRCLILLKDASDQTIWSKYVEFITLNNAYIVDVCFDSFDNVLLCGWSQSTDYNLDGIALTTSGFVAKIDAAGITQWFHGVDNFYPSSIATNSLGDVILGGYCRDTLNFAGSTYISYPGGMVIDFPFDICLLSLSTNEEEQWFRTYGGSYTEEITDLAVDQNDFIYSSGDLQSGVIFNNLSVPFGSFLFKHDLNGQEIWSKSFSQVTNPTAINAISKKVTVDEFGNIYWLNSFHTDTLSTGIGLAILEECDFFDGDILTVLCKYNNAGEIQNYISISCAPENRTWDMYAMGENLVISGTLGSTVHLANNVTLSSDTYADNGFVLMLDSNFNVVWHLETAEQNDDASIVINHIFELGSQLRIAGSFRVELQLGEFNFFPVDLHDNFIATIDTTNSVLETDQLRIGIYPNPVNDFLYFSESVHLQSGKSKVYNAVGQQVEVIVNKYGIDTSHLMSGFYLAIVESEVGRVTLRFIKE